VLNGGRQQRKDCYDAGRRQDCVRRLLALVPHKAQDKSDVETQCANPECEKSASETGELAEPGVVTELTTSQISRQISRSSCTAVLYAFQPLAGCRENHVQNFDARAPVDLSVLRRVGGDPSSRTRMATMCAPTNLGAHAIGPQIPRSSDRFTDKVRRRWSQLGDL